MTCSGATSHEPVPYASPGLFCTPLLLWGGGELTLTYPACRKLLDELFLVNGNS